GLVRIVYSQCSDKRSASCWRRESTVPGAIWATRTKALGMRSRYEAARPAFRRCTLADDGPTWNWSFTASHLLGVGRNPRAEREGRMTWKSIFAVTLGAALFASAAAEAASCKKDADCSSGQVCSNGTCVKRA